MRQQKGQTDRRCPVIAESNESHTSLSPCIRLDVGAYVLGHYTNMHMYNKLETLRRTAKWWWRTRVRMFWMTPLPTGKSTGSLILLWSCTEFINYGRDRATYLLPDVLVCKACTVRDYHAFVQQFWHERLTFLWWTSLPSLACGTLRNRTALWVGASEGLGY